MLVQLKIFAAYLFLLGIYGVLWILVFRILNNSFDLLIQSGIYASIISSVMILLISNFKKKNSHDSSFLKRKILIDNIGLTILTFATGLAFLFSVAAINDRSLSVYLTATVAKNPSGVKMDELSDFIALDWNENNKQLEKRIREQVLVGNFRIEKNGEQICPTKQLVRFTKMNNFITRIIGINPLYVDGSKKIINREKRNNRICE
jgi:hypothetical protein